MRWAIALGIGVLWTAALPGQDAKQLTRYGVIAIYNKYPQGTAKEALASVLRALDVKQYDYVLAHLTDPAFVDRRVKQYNGKFEELVEETRVKLTNNPETIKLLHRFHKEGDWEEAEGAASIKLKAVKDQQVFLKRLDKRWYLENRMVPTAEGK